MRMRDPLGRSARSRWVQGEESRRRILLYVPPSVARPGSRWVPGGEVGRRRLLLRAVCAHISKYGMLLRAAGLSRSTLPISGSMSEMSLKGRIRGRVGTEYQQAELRGSRNGEGQLGSPAKVVSAALCWSVKPWQTWLPCGRPSSPSGNLT